MKDYTPTTELDFVVNDIKILSYNGREYDLKHLYTSFEIFEDLMDGLYARITVRDAVDMLTLMPIVGNEVVEINFTKPEPTGDGLYDEYKIKLRVFSVANVIELNAKTKSYEIYLVSREFKKNEGNKIFYSWKDVPYSDIVEDIYSNFIKEDKKIKIEKTEGRFDYCTGNRKPYQVINLLASRSRSAEQSEGVPHGEGFFFYEDHKRFNFVSIGSLLLQKPSQTFIKRLGSMRDKNGVKDLELDYRRIIDLVEPATMPVVDSMRRGLYGAEAVTVDLVRQKFGKKEFKISEEWKNFPKLEKQRFFRKDAEYVDNTSSSRKLIISKTGQNEQEHLVTRDPTLKQDFFEDILMKRSSKLLQLYQNRIFIVVPGDPRLVVGQIVELEMPESAGDVNEERPEKINRYKAGKFLITSLRHLVTRVSFYTMLELTKDSFRSKIEHEDLIERYSEIY